MKKYSCPKLADFRSDCFCVLGLAKYLLVGVLFCFGFFSEKKSGSSTSPVDHQIGEFPKARLPLVLLHPKAGTQGTVGSPCIISPEKATSLKAGGTRAVWQRAGEVLPVSLTALLFTAAGVLSPAKNRSCLSWSLAQDILNGD